MLEMHKRMDTEEQRRKDQEAAQAAVAAGGPVVGSPTYGGSSGSGSVPVVSAPHATGVGSNRGEQCLKPFNLPEGCR